MAAAAWETHHLAKLVLHAQACGTAATSPRWPDRPLKSTCRSWLVSCSSSSSSSCSPRSQSGRIAPQAGRGTMSRLEKEQRGLPGFLSAAKPNTPWPRITAHISESFKTNCKALSIGQPRVRQSLGRLIVLGLVESRRQLSGATQVDLLRVELAATQQSLAILIRGDLCASIWASSSAV